MSFVKTIEKRRSIYAIGKHVQQSPAELDALIRNVVKQSPSSFNSQSSRTVNLFGEHHVKFWEIVRETLRRIVPAESFATTSAKIDSFANGFATVLFYEDQSVIKGLQDNFPAYAENFPIWSEHSSAIAQFAVWTALAELNIGASLQHYNPIIDDEVAKTFDIPAHWKLRAQLVFGSIEAPAGEKTYISEETRFKTFF